MLLGGRKFGGFPPLLGEIFGVKFSTLAPPPSKSGRQIFSRFRQVIGLDPGYVSPKFYRISSDSFRSVMLKFLFPQPKCYSCHEPNQWSLILGWILLHTLRDRSRGYSSTLLYYYYPVAYPTGEVDGAIAPLVGKDFL